MPGPLPTANPRRRNAPTIPTTNLPATGRPGRPPKSPIELGASGSAWWSWAWKTPQAAGWSTGDLYLVARRASLQDDIDALEQIDGLDFAELGDRADEVRSAVARVAALATGRLQIAREMREIENLLGLTPKGLAALRWKIVAEKSAAAAAAEDEVGRRRERKVKAVDSDAVAGS